MAEESQELDSISWPKSNLDFASLETVTIQFFCDESEAESTECEVQKL